MVFKSFCSLQISTDKRQTSRFTKRHFVLVGLPYNKAGMPELQALRLVDTWNFKGHGDWQYWLSNEL